jgi:hypothetical protein
MSAADACNSAISNSTRGGIEPLADASVLTGAQSIARGELIPGKDPAHFAYLNTAVHRNLYRISLP